MNLINSNTIALHGVISSEIGGRPENQDDFGFIDTPVGFLVLICDGMGGGPGGKTASYIVKQVIGETLSSCNPDMPRDQAFKMAVSNAQDALLEKMKLVPELSGMGSTFVALLLTDKSAVVAHAGDSRCYQFRKGKCVFKSEDHSLVAELVRNKALTEEQARTSPQSNVISRGLGCVKNNAPDIQEIPYRYGDRFVLCTDGVWGSMPANQLYERLCENKDLIGLVTSIQSEIDNIGFSKGGKHDNHTIAIVDVLANSKMKLPLDLKKIALVCLMSVIATCSLGIISFKCFEFVRSKLQVSTEISDSTTSEVGSMIDVGQDRPNDGQNGIEDKGKLDSIGNIKVDSIPAISDEIAENIKDKIKKVNPKTEEGKDDGDSQNKEKGKDNDSRKEDGKTDDILSNGKFTPLELIEKTVDNYHTSCNVQSDKVELAQKKLDDLKKKINVELAELKDLLKEQALRESVGVIIKENDSKSWYVDSQQKDGKYIPTNSTLKLLNIQIKRLEELRSKLNNGNNNTTE